MPRRPYAIILILAILTVGLLGLAGRAVAQQPASAPPSATDDIEVVYSDPLGGADIVFLIDNSGSMFCDLNDELQCAGPGSDPDQWRFAFVRYTADWLATDTLERHPNREHRLGVVTFGSSDQAGVDLDLLSLKVPTSAQLDERRQLVEKSLRTTDMGSTDFLSAYDKAASLPWTPAPAGKERIKALILLTDGHPWVPSVNGVPRLLANGSENPAFKLTYFAALQRALDERFPAATQAQSTQGYHRWVVFLGSDFGTVRNEWTRIVGDNYRQILSYNEIPRTVHEVMSAIYPMGEMIPPQFEMPPYLSGVLFTVFGLSPLTDASVVTFRAADGQPIALDKIERVQTYGNAIITYQIADPAPGRWSYVSSGDTKVDVAWDRFLPRVVLAEPTAAPTQFTEAPITLRLEDSHGNPVQALPEYPIAFDVILTKPDSVRLPLALVSLGGGAFSTSSPVLMDLAGEYLLDTQATTQYAQGKTWAVVAPTRHSFRVGPPQGKLTWTEKGATLAPFHSHELMFELVSPKGQRLSLAPEYGLQALLEMSPKAPGASPSEMTVSPDGRLVSTLFVANTDRPAGSAVAVASIQGAELCRATLGATDVGTLVVANMISAADANVVKQGVATRLAFEVTWEGGAFEPEPAAPLDLSASFAKGPGGVTIPLNGWKSAGPGQFELQHAFSASGDWEIHVKGAITLPSGESVQAFAEAVWPVKVIETVQAGLAIVAPEHGAKFTHRQPETAGSVLWFSRPAIRPLAITAQTLAGQGKSASAATPLAGMAQSGVTAQSLLSASLIGPDRQDYAARLHWQTDAQDGSLLRAELTAPYPAGVYRLSVDWSPQAADGLLPQYAPQSAQGRYVEFEIVDEAGPLGGLTQAVPYLWLLVLLTGVVAALYGRAQPLGGMLLLRELTGDHREMRIPISSRWRWLTVKPVGPVATKAGVTRIRVVSQGPGRVRVTLHAKNNPAATSDLYTGHPALNAVKNTLQLIYEPPPAVRSMTPRPTPRPPIQRPPLRRPPPVRH